MSQWSDRGFQIAPSLRLSPRAAGAIESSSDGLGWRAMYAAFRRTEPFEASFAAAKGIMLVVQRNEGVVVEQRMGGRWASKRLPRGALSIRPIGMDHETRLRTPAEAGHIYLHASLLKEVAPDICAHDPDRLELLPVFGEADAVMARLVEAVRELTIQPIPASNCASIFWRPPWRHSLRGITRMRNMRSGCCRNCRCRGGGRRG
ncbi:hypothetical protein [Bradyrhizobium jicamae]|uniref:hypothetical protein n=1 Tax=Bradyrhizobium jicamae TaxID=280332 RepID=UPI001BAD77D7|nr:hypothetical protein [Bradyrhizobium jicamae]MBR0935285.1 hypothetical protein [Bradyrhizobium jicamae]